MQSGVVDDIQFDYNEPISIAVVHDEREQIGSPACRN